MILPRLHVVFSEKGTWLSSLLGYDGFVSFGIILLVALFVTDVVDIYIFCMVFIGVI